MAASAFIVCVPEAEPYVAHWRQRLDPSAALGVPAHITVLHPFMSAELVTPEVVNQIAAFAASLAPFAFSLSKIRRFPGVLCLDPEPDADFVALTKGLVARFPDYPAYGGQHHDIIPHLTVARAGADELDAIEAQLRAALDSSPPVTAVCSAMVLIENSSGRWKTMHRFALGRAT